MKDIPEHMRGPKRSDLSHNFWNYGMTAEEVAEYLKKKKRRKETATDTTPRLIAAE